jgi:hypothetical protein
MDPLQLAREILQDKYPEFTPEEIQLELNEFTEDDLDTEVEVAKKSLKLKKFNADGKKQLEEYKSKFNTTEGAGNIPEDYKKAFEFTQEILKEDAANKKSQEAYTSSIKKVVEGAKSLKLQLSDDLVIDFDISKEDKGMLPKFIEQMPHWYNEDGSYNHQSVVIDAIKVKNFDNIMKLVFDQGVAKGKEMDDSESRNVTLADARNTQGSGEFNKDDIVVEGAEGFGSNSTPKLRFGRK